MIFLAVFIVPVLALWLWLPWWRGQRRTFWWGAALTVLVGVAPALLIMAMRSNVMSYSVIAPLQVVSGSLLATLGMSALWSFVRDGAVLLARATGRRALAHTLYQPQVTGVVVVLLALLCACGAWQGVRPPQVRLHEVNLPRLPAELDGLRVAVLADIHSSPVNNAAYVQTIVDRTLAAQPDLIVLPGDMVDGDAPTQAPNIAPLAQLKAPHGVWSAPGNHEYYSGYLAWAREFDKVNLHYLQNRTARLEIAGRTVAVSGLGDPAYGRLSEQNADPLVPEGVPPDIAAVVQQAKGADLHILLAHQPKPAREYALHGGVDLQISGHTHGGHIRGMDRWLVAPANNGFVRGLYELGDMRLFVSSGAGLWAGFTVRLGVPPAIEVLVLRSPAAVQD